MLLGSTQNLLDSNRMLSMQEDVHSHRISSEVMKNRLYESVIMSPHHRRMSQSTSNNFSEYNPFKRMVFSMPVTPAHSGNASPTNSPTLTTKRRQFRFGYHSREMTPRMMSPEREISEDGFDISSCQGLASIFRPIPKVIRATDSLVDDVEMEDDPRPNENNFSANVSNFCDDMSLSQSQDNESMFKRPMPIRERRFVKRKGLFS